MALRLPAALLLEVGPFVLLDFSAYFLHLGLVRVFQSFDLLPFLFPGLLVISLLEAKMLRELEFCQLHWCGSLLNSQGVAAFVFGLVLRSLVLILLLAVDSDVINWYGLLLAERLIPDYESSLGASQVLSSELLSLLLVKLALNDCFVPHAI